ncbi:MAG: SGNH/GDSL hydrolase family protein [Arachnia sp.]
MSFARGFVAGAAAAAVGAVGIAYLRGARLIARNVDDYRTHWGSGRGEHDGDVLHYVVLGDSAAQGVGATHVGASYVSLIADRLREATGRPVAITNLSVSGAVSGDVVVDQLPVLRELQFTPDLVTVDIGGNDVVFSATNTVDSFAESFEEILRALPKGSFVGDIPWFTVPTLGRRARKMSERARELVPAYGHHLVPLYEATRDLGFLHFHRHTAGDWFHPNDKGYRAWADLYWSAIVASGRVAELMPPHDFAGPVDAR